MLQPSGRKERKVRIPSKERQWILFSFHQKAKFIEPYDKKKYQGPMLSQEVFCDVLQGVLNHNCRSTYLQNKEAQIFLGKLKIEWGKGALPHFQGRAGIILREGYSLRRGNTVKKINACAVKIILSGKFGVEMPCFGHPSPRLAWKWIMTCCHRLVWLKI